MKAASLLDELRQRGVEVSLQGTDIAYRGPKGAMTPQLLDAFRSQKQEIVSELQIEARNDDSGFEHLTRLVELELESDLAPDHDFARYVEPIKSQLLQRVGLDVEFTRGQDCWLFDANGKQYLDCIAQYGGLPFGYNPKEIWDAVQSVHEKMEPSVGTQSLLGPAGELANKLLSLLPDSFEHVVFCNSGAEATEVAIKLTRAAKQRPGILSARLGFHGLTTGALSATGSDSFQNGFFVRSENFQYVPFGDAVALENKIRNHPQHFAAFVVEPIQGEAGIIVPPESYWIQAREICDRYGVLLVLDEVQTGLGRTGSMFACEQTGIVPDVITLAKALGGGLVPTGSVICQTHAYSVRFGLRHSSTFAGNALASRCGIAALDVLLADDKRLIKSVRANGQRLLNGLCKLRDKYPQLVSDVRGLGYMLAIEFDFNTLKQRKGLLPVLVEQQMLLHLIISYLLHRHGIRLAPSFMGRDVIRLEPPLVFDDEQCGMLLTALDDTLRVVDQGKTARLVAMMIGSSPAEIAERDETLSRTVGSPKLQPIIEGNVRESNRFREKASVAYSDSRLVGEFGFLVHLTSLADLVQFDADLKSFNEQELAKLKHEFTRSSEPAVIGTTDFYSTEGLRARGHFVLVPYTPQELLEMPLEMAVEQVANAADAAARLNVGSIGLGGFTSIVTSGGLALDNPNLPPITSGNALTVSSTVSAIEDVSCRKSITLEDTTVAVVGAGGQIGRGVAIILSEMAARVILVGRDGTDERTIRGLQSVAQEIIDNPASRQVAEITIAKDICEIVAAEIVVVASSAPHAIIASSDIRSGAIVCDSSRPANVSEEVRRSRPDVNWIEGGLISIPGNKNLDMFAGPRADAAYACVAETALWTLESSLGRPSAVQMLDIDLIQKLGRVAKKHGFEVLV